jgi:hypothetical protein
MKFFFYYTLVSLLFVSSIQHSVQPNLTQIEVNNLSNNSIDLFFQKYSNKSSITSAEFNEFLNNIYNLLVKSDNDHDHSHAHDESHEHINHDDVINHDSNCFKSKLNNLKIISTNLNQIDKNDFKMISNVVLTGIDSCFIEKSPKRPKKIKIDTINFKKESKYFKYLFEYFVLFKFN